MNETTFVVYPFAADNNKFLIIEDDSMRISNDYTLHLKYLLDAKTMTL
jgi:hypothetical protein